MSSLHLQPKQYQFPMKNVGKTFGIPMSLGGVRLISGIAQ